MDWSITLCVVFANVIPNQGDDLRRRFNFGKVSSRDYFGLGEHVSDPSPGERLVPGHIILTDAVQLPQLGRNRHSSHYRKSSNLPNILRNYLERRLSKFADKRRSSLHSEEVKQSILPPSEPARPGHTLLQPMQTMLKSSAKYPRTNGISLVYGSQDNLGINHGQTPYRVLYSDFRKDNLAEVFMNLFKDPNPVGSLRRSSNSKRKLRDKKKALKEKNKSSKFKKHDSKRAQMYRSDFDSNELRNSNHGIRSRGKIRHYKRKTIFKNQDPTTSDDSKETKIRALKTAEHFEKHDRKINPKLNKKLHGKLEHKKNLNVNGKLAEKLEQKLKTSKLKKQVPLDTYKKKMSSKLKRKPALTVRHSNSYKESSMAKRFSKKESWKYSDLSSEDSYSDEHKSRGYKKHKEKTKKLLKRSKKKRIFRQADSDEENQPEENEVEENKSDEKILNNEEEKTEKKKSKDKKNQGRLVYGSPDNYGIVWGKTPYRNMYTDFRRTSNLLGKILEAYHSYKKDKKIKKALVAIKVWPFDKTRENPVNLDKVHNQVLDNSNEILDDVSIDVDIEVADFRKQRRKSKTKVKSAFRNRDESYDKGNATKDCGGDDSEEAEESDESDYEKNPGNPYTLFKNKYQQNWPWHFELGDHINLNPFGPEFNNQGGPSGPELFFNRKWWYFNQDDFIPFR